MSSIDADSQPDEDDRGDPSVPKIIPDILWALTNADKMKKDFWLRLETRLLDIYRNHKGIRFLLTSSAECRKFSFTCFHKEEELESMFQHANTQQRLRRM